MLDDFANLSEIEQLRDECKDLWGASSEDDSADLTRIGCLLRGGRTALTSATSSPI